MFFFFFFRAALCTRFTCRSRTADVVIDGYTDQSHFGRGVAICENYAIVAQGMVAGQTEWRQNAVWIFGKNNDGSWNKVAMTTVLPNCDNFGNGDQGCENRAQFNNNGAVGINNAYAFALQHNNKIATFPMKSDGTWNTENTLLISPPGGGSISQFTNTENYICIGDQVDKKAYLFDIPTPGNPLCRNSDKTCVCSIGFEGDNCKYITDGMCGDGELNQGEECDENTISCSSDCRLTSVAACDGTHTCVDGNTVSSQPPPVFDIDTILTRSERFASGEVANTDTWAIVGDRVQYKAFIYKNTGSTWSLSPGGSLTSPTSGHTQFGFHVAICDAGYALVGSPAGTGSANIYKWTGTTWSAQNTFNALGRCSALGITGEWAAVGCRGLNTVYLYKNIGNDWSRTFVLNQYSSGWFGHHLDLTSNYLIISAPGDKKAYIFDKKDIVGSEWSETAADAILHEVSASASFGVSVAISSTYAIVGEASGNQPADRKKAWVYQKVNDAWDTTAIVVLDNPTGLIGGMSTYGKFAESVGITEHNLLVYSGGVVSHVYYYSKSSNGEWKILPDMYKDFDVADGPGEFSNSENYAFVGQDTPGTKVSVLRIPIDLGQPLCHDSDKTCVCKVGYSGSRCET